MNLGFLSSPNRWAAFMSGLLFLLSVGYLVWHYIDKPGSKNIMLSPTEQADVQNILDGPAPTNTDEDQTADSLAQTGAVTGTLSNTATYTVRRNQVFEYIKQTHTMLDTADNNQLNRALLLMPDERSLRTYLSTHPIRVYSPYHLNGRKLLWELILWAWFGVFCNLFYRVSEAYKGAEVKKTDANPAENVNEPAPNEPGGSSTPKSDEVTLLSLNLKPGSYRKLTVRERLQRRMLGGFDLAEVPSHIAKLIYTPFLVVIIYLAVVSFGNTTDLQWVQFGEGVIVFAFILGFFSGRMVDLLERLKDLILPIGRFGNEPPTRNSITEGPPPVTDQPENADPPDVRANDPAVAAV